jgi:antitoxin CptB
MTNAIALETRRKRAKFRAWHRGMKEMDMILGGFVDAQFEALSHGDLDQLEFIMDALDRDLFKWFTGEGAVPADFDLPMFARICDFHKIDLSARSAGSNLSSSDPANS